MHPSVGISMQRYAPKGGIELGGKLIPAGYRVGMNPAVVHYGKSDFGEERKAIGKEFPHLWSRHKSLHWEKREPIVPQFENNSN
jgi:hypothetical protein